MCSLPWDGSGTDPCVLSKEVLVQRMSFTHPEQLATPTYKIQEKKIKLDALVEPSQVSLVGLVDLNQSVGSSLIFLCKALVGESSLLQQLSDLVEEWSTRFYMVGSTLNSRIKLITFFILTGS